MGILTIDHETILTSTPVFSADDVILLAAYASRTENQDAIDASVVQALGDAGRARAAGMKEYASRGLRALAVAYEIDGDIYLAEGNGFELISLLAIFDPPRENTKQTIEDALALEVKVKMVTAKMFKDGPAPDSPYTNLDELILDADGFAGVFPEHKYDIVMRLQGLGHLCAMTGNGANDAPALSRANVGIAVEGATDAARGAADIVLTKPGLSTIVHAIRGSRVIFQRMRNYAIYACAVTIRIVVCFAILAFVYKFDFPPSMILIIALLNDGTIMTLSVDHVLPSSTPDRWDLAEIFSYAVVYGLYLNLSTVSFVVIILETTFFQDKFVEHNDYQLHMVVYLQVAIISQALIFVTRSHAFFFMERPSMALLEAFCVAQLIASIIAAYANCFTKIHGIHGGWIGIVWVWVRHHTLRSFPRLDWLALTARAEYLVVIPLDLIKFAMKATVIKFLREGHLERQTAGPFVGDDEPIWRSQSHTSVHESLYSNRVNLIKRTARKVGFGQKISVKSEELQRFSSLEAQRSMFMPEIPAVLLLEIGWVLYRFIRQRIAYYVFSRQCSLKITRHCPNAV
ncbi:HAD-like domain-containing protein [Mycena crocata]|nr:HAD-like domain-containing protein [Mycena crocata]